MHPNTNRTRGRAVPPQSLPEQEIPAVPIVAADEFAYEFGLVELCFTPSLTWRAFRRFAGQYGLVHMPQTHESQIFLSRSGVEVAYGKHNYTPLPRQVEELWLVGTDGTRVDAVIALAGVMLSAWPHAHWTPDKHDGFTDLLRSRFPDREGPARRPWA